MRDKRVMESLDEIDSNWIKSRLKGERGEIARIAEALGVKPDQASKIVSGVRRLQANEIPLIARFFGEEAVVITPEEKKILQLYHAAPADRVAAVDVLLAYRTRPQDTP